MEQKIGVKNTKNEILAAYDELLKKMQEQKTDEPKKVQEQQKKENLVKSAVSLSNEGIIKEVSGLVVNPRQNKRKFHC